MSTQQKQPATNSRILSARRRHAIAPTWVALLVLIVALTVGTILGTFIVGFLSFLQPYMPFLFSPVTLVNYTFIPIGLVLTSLATLPVFFLLLRKTLSHQEIAAV